MPNRSSGRGYRVQPELTAFLGQVHTPSSLVAVQQQYYYQEYDASYYGVPHIHNPASYSHGDWYQTGIPNQLYSSTSPLTKSLAQGSKFSPDAPEFIPKALKQQPMGEQDSSKQSNNTQKKKKKKKGIATNGEKPPSEVTVQAKGILLDSSKAEQSGDLGEGSTSTAEFPKTDTPRTSASIIPRIKSSQISSATKESEPRPQKCVKFQEPLKESGARKKDKIQHKSHIADSVNDAKQANWPGLQENPNADTDRKLVVQQRMSFAEKLKNAPAKSPFLDWRDQRTNSASSQKPAANTQLPKQPVKPENISMDETQKDKNDDGFITVTRKSKGKDKKDAAIETISSSQANNVRDGAKKNPEELAKKKADREKKKQREKEKKKKAREEKLLAEKLAPKGQKVTFITPAVMEKFVQNKQATTKVAPPVSIFADEFPALGVTKSRGNTSESESEWETTEVEVQVDSSPILPSTAATQRNVKRSDPIKYDLMALITKKTNLKEKPKKQEGEKKTKNRAGVVANVLDRSAPVLSRGKIRNKKPKLSDIRKALLAAKAKRKALGNLTNRPPSQRPHKLHSKKFREYCDQMLTDRIDQLARDMLYHLRTFQDRAFKKDPIKARMKKRLVAGLREVTKQVERKRIKIIFLAPDIQRCPETGGLDEAVRRLLDSARKHDLSIVYALSRRKMGRVLMKNVPVSCCGVLNYQATEETWKELSKAVSLARKEYQEKMKQLGLASEPSNSNESPETEVPSIPANLEKPVANAEENVETGALLSLLKLSFMQCCLIKTTFLMTASL